MQKKLSYFGFITLLLIFSGSLNLLVEAQGGFSANINFQTESTTPPIGYVEDFGEPFGVRNGAEQGSGTYTYGWIETATNNPVDLTIVPNADGTARNRGTSQPDLRLDTLVHMDHPNAGAIEGYWEIQVPGRSI